MRVRLEVRRFVCRTRSCPRTTFAERFPQLTRAYARRTLRQAEALTEVAFANGGKAGAQLAKRLAMPTSCETLLRLIRSTAVPQRKTPQVLGLDDFRLEKRRPLRHAAGRPASPLSGRGAARSGSGHRRARASCASGRKDHQSRPCGGLCGGSHTRRSARQASRGSLPYAGRAFATRSKAPWLERLGACRRWQ